MVHLLDRLSRATYHLLPLTDREMPQSQFSWPCGHNHSLSAFTFLLLHFLESAVGTGVSYGEDHEARLLGMVGSQG